MARKSDVSFFQPTQDRTSPEARRRDAMAELIARSSQQPEGTEVISGVAVQQSPIAGLAKALGMGVSGYQSAKAEQAEQSRKDAARQTMAQAMEAYNRSQSGGQTQLADGDAINWNVTEPNRAGAMYADLLMQNEDTAPIGMQTQMGQMQTKMNNANELDMYKQKFPMELELARQKAQIAQQYAKPSDGGATGYLVNQVMADNPGMSFTEALYSVQTGMRQGLGMSGGAVAPIQGAPDALSAISEAKQTGQNISDLTYKPQIRQQEAAAGEVGKRIGEAQGTLTFLQANMPKLEEVTNKLSTLGKTATYTGAGRAVDAAQREMGMDVGPGGIARSEYIATVDNEILPLLRDTFGAAFTVAEGDRLRATLGDANKSPAEKDALLRAFIDQKKSQVTALQRQVGQPNMANPYATTNPAISTPVDQIQPMLNADFGNVPKIASDADYDALPPGAEFIGPDGQKRRKQ